MYVFDAVVHVPPCFGRSKHYLLFSHSSLPITKLACICFHEIRKRTIHSGAPKLSKSIPSIALLPTLMTAATVKLAPTTAPPMVPAVPKPSGTPMRNNRYFPTKPKRLASLCAVSVPKRVPLPIATEGRAVLTRRVFCTARNLACCSTISASESVSAEATCRVEEDASDMVAAISVSSIPDQRECTTRPVSDDVARDGSTTRRRRWGNFDLADEVADMMSMLRNQIVSLAYHFHHNIAKSSTT